MDFSGLHIRNSLAKTTRAGFTLVELLVATAILALILVLTLSLINNATALTRHTRSRVETFQESRAGFEAMTRNISQTVLNTYWDYEYPGSPPDATQPPTGYVRQSELHFISDKAQSGGSRNLLSETGLATASHAIFFLAPRGSATPPAAPRPKLDNLLNACGYYVQFGSDADFLPPFLASGPVVPARYRYRLMEMLQPTGKLSIYADFEAYRSSPSERLLRQWFIQPLGSASPPVHILAENIIALVLTPQRSPHDVVPAGAPPVLAPLYYYDSRRHLLENTDLAKVTRAQLPPMVRVTMVALDEASAARLQGVSTAAPVIPVGDGKTFTDLFSDGSKCDEDLASLEKGLAAAHLTYRVFDTSVSILQSKWSE